jgi:hypothetical protein
LGISEKTLRRRKKEMSELSAAIEKGKARAGQKVANKLMELCMKGNLGAIVWFEKTRRGLSDKMELSGDENKPMAIRIEYVNDWRNQTALPASGTDNS